MSRDIVVEALWRVTAWGVGARVGQAHGRGRQAAARAVPLTGLGEPLG